MGPREGMTLGLAYRRLCRHQIRWWGVLVILITWTVRLPAQDPGSSPPPADSSKPATEPKPEVSTRDTNTTFKLRVNLVQVRVVVRDSKGRPVEGLKPEDFQLYDQGKLQAITTFGVETPRTRAERADTAAKTQQVAGEEVGGEKVAMPERFVALVFDDIHLKIEDATFVRASAKALIESMTPTDRMGVFGTSEQLTREFTNDKAALNEALLGLVPRPKMGKINATTNCPDVTHYMADQSLNQHNDQILPIVAEETLQCQFQGDTRQTQAALIIAQSALQEALVAGDTDNEYTYRALEDVMRRLTGKPGERILVLASPGFLLSTQFLDEMGIIDRANQASIVINTVDARGLYTPDIGGDISSPRTDTYRTAGFKTTYRTQEQMQNEYVMMDFASGTGGTFFHNSNDLETGLKRAGAAPEVSYMLGFSPQNQKMDGKYHTIKVSIVKQDKGREKSKYDIQARRGYYASRKLDDPEAQAKQEIADAIFSQDEIHELPLDLQTQYFKTEDAGAHLSVISRIDVKGIHFRKAEGRDFDSLTVATVIFDENGNYVIGGEKVLEMRLLGPTYERLSRTGLTMKSSFDLKPGKYLVRQVVRDSEGAQMAARSGAVVIPY
jgi:VWFA-related protein